MTHPADASLNALRAHLDAMADDPLAPARGVAWALALMAVVWVLVVVVAVVW